MQVEIYDTLSRKRRPLEPENNTVRIYHCGMTVQARPHVGHLRGYIVMDAFRRFLRHTGYEVKLVQNITDIDDKVIEKSRAEGIDWRMLAERNTRELLDVTAALNIEPPTVMSRATQHIEEIIDLVKKIIDAGHAYEASGDVYFDVRSYPKYGKLSGKNVDDLMEGVRKDVADNKRDPLDFALWKAAKEGEPFWHSPWGRGRPGWHIECSAMSTHYLGLGFDLHAGGEDLVFPHHENEIAQYESATGKPFAKAWMHVEMLNLRGEKMSKSTGHVVLAKEVLERYEANVLRLYTLRIHYRAQTEYTMDGMDEARSAWERITNFLAEVKSALTERSVATSYPEFEAALADDFNTPKAVGLIFDLVRDGNEALAEGGTENLADISSKLNLGLKLLGFEPLEKQDSSDELDKILALVADFRAELRAAKAFEWADKLRAMLAESGLEIKDTKDGTRIRFK
ncbi:cysteine--tRNA ligase [candidate division WOR-3 bacterium]|uniref:Cysteine--tRNA ligase n=1 Tax=candidate division WOR-3 bacterium TaxID=2052148 RepID=A0A9D5QD40_UNCW3|nr:cysteine--tRNA ligase [candidate division WOR-3 bacterium]MBD3363690.1 cysteine--tRNA ligase [candidate division WOR-3 bacterium]